MEPELRNTIMEGRRLVETVVVLTVSGMVEEGGVEKRGFSSRRGGASCQGGDREC